MLYFLYYFLLVANVVQTFIRKKNILLLMATLAFMFFLFFSNDASGHDHYLYKIGFENADQELGFEVLYTAIVAVIKGFGVKDYNAFLSVYFIICMTLQYIGLRGYLKLAHPLLALYMVFIFPQWAIAIRIFLALSIVVFSLRFLFKGKWVYYFGAVILATAVHFSVAPLALLCLFFSRTSIKKMENAEYSSNILKLMLPTFLLISFVSYFLAESDVYGTTTALLSSVMGSDATSDIDNKITSYFESKTKLGFVIFFVVYAVNLLMALKMKNIAAGKMFKDDITLRKLSFAGAAINLFSSFTLPLVVLNLVFGRLMAVGSIVNMVTLSRYLVVFGHLQQKTRGVVLLLFVLTLLAWAIPAVLEINSISPNGLIETAILYWGGVVFTL